VRGLEGITLATADRFTVEPESVFTVPVAVTVPHEFAAGGNIIEFVVEDVDDPDVRVVEESRFRGPVAY